MKKMFLIGLYFCSIGRLYGMQCPLGLPHEGNSMLAQKYYEEGKRLWKEKNYLAAEASFIKAIDLADLYPNDLYHESIEAVASVGLAALYLSSATSSNGLWSLFGAGVKSSPAKACKYLMRARRIAEKRPDLHEVLAVVDKLMMDPDNLFTSNSEGLTPLQAAVMHDEKSKVTNILAEGAKLQGWREQLMSAFDLVLRDLKESMVELFLTKGTPWDELHAAIFRNSPAAIVEKLLGSEKAVGRTDSCGLTPLHVACWVGNLELCVLLVEKGASFAASDMKDRTPADIIIIKGHALLAQTFLEGILKIDSKAHGTAWLLHRAAEHGHETLVALLLAKGANPNSTGVTQGTRTPLSIAKTLPVAKLLVENGATVDLGSTHVSPLNSAAGGGKIGIVGYLLENGASIKGTDLLASTALICAIKEGRESAVAFLLMKGAIPTDEAIIASIERGNEHIFLLLLLKRQGEVGDAAVDMCKYLDRAVLSSKVEIIAEMLPYLRKDAIQKSFALAVEQGSLNVVSFLLHYGCPVNPWHYGLAVLRGYRDLFLLLKMKDEAVRDNSDQNEAIAIINDERMSKEEKVKLCLQRLRSADESSM